LDLVIPHTAVFSVLSIALSKAMEGVVCWVDPVRLEEVVKLTVDLVLSKRLARKAEEGGFDC
jgi:hypothetical protein